MYVYNNPNPRQLKTGDCVIRAIAIAMNKSWYESYVGVCLKGLEMSMMPSDNGVWGEFLKNNGFKRRIVSDTCPQCYTVRDFCSEHFKGTYILGTGSHAIACVDGDYYDTWDSGDEIPIYYFTEAYDE